MTTLTRAALLLSAATALRAQATPAPSQERPPLFTRNDAIWSAAVLAGSIAISKADSRLAKAFTDPTRHTDLRNSLARNFSKVQEGSLTFGNLALWGIARLAKAPAMADVTFHAAEAVVVGSLASQVIRGPLGRSRPHVTNYENQYDFHPFRGFREFRYRAFPSIHTASAFAVATVYTLETHRRSREAAMIVGPIAYLLAAGPGVARMYNGQHWASDVLSGAFVGTLAGVKVLRYNHDIAPRNRVNRFFLGPKNVQLTVGEQGRSFGFAYARTF